jgi:hypothetical protein
MKLTLKRIKFSPKSTVGELYIDDKMFCYTLEDVVRDGPKVSGKTAIPYGKYKVIIDYSNRFKKDMPHLLNVPGFEGIRIHSGNTSEHTEGCLLLGKGIINDDFISESKAACAEFFPKLQAGLKEGEVWIDIVRG